MEITEKGSPVAFDDKQGSFSTCLTPCKNITAEFRLPLKKSTLNEWMCEGLFYLSLSCELQPWAIKNPQCSCWGRLWTGIFFLCLHHQMSEACARSFSIWKDKTHKRQSKMSSSNKLTCKRDFAACVYLSDAQNPISPPPTYTMYVYTGTYSHRGKGGELNQSREEGERGNSSQSWVKKNMADCIHVPSINSYKCTPWINVSFP